MNTAPAPRKKPAAALPRLRRSDLPVRAAFAEPATAFEIQVAELWRDVLNVDRVGTQDDFFDLGGDSLTATELFLELERWFAVRLSTSEILEHSTVARLAALLGSGAQRQSDRCLIPLQPDGVGAPLFLVHDMTGGVMSYRHMLRRMGNRRKIFGLQYPGPVESATSVMGFRDMCAIYAGAIRAAWPQGPYYLAGYSLGSRIAFEIATQLAAAGGEVRLLALLDGATRKGKLRGIQRVARKFARTLFVLADVNAGRWPGFLLGALARELRRIWKKERRWGAVRPRDFSALIEAEGDAHVPSVYRGAVRIMRSTDGPEYFNRKYLGWDKYVLGPLDVFDISADHATLMTEPRVAVVAACLESWIREADTAARPPAVQ